MIPKPLLRLFSFSSLAWHPAHKQDCFEFNLFAWPARFQYLSEWQPRLSPELRFVFLYLFEISCLEVLLETWRAVLCCAVIEPRPRQAFP